MITSYILFYQYTWNTGGSMATEKWSPQEYADEELLSFDRVKRAVISRVFAREELLGGEARPLDREKTVEIINDEWQRAKAAIRSSPNARAYVRRQLEEFVAEEVDSVIRSDKEELLSMGVVEKSI
jgi:hypothetical protein